MEMIKKDVRKDVKNNKLLIYVISSVLVILFLVGGYFLLFQPWYNQQISKAQNQGFEYAIFSVAIAASNCSNNYGVVPLVIGNQTMNIIWTNCIPR